MSVLLFGVFHRSAPVSGSRTASTDESDQIKIVRLQSPLVTEAMMLSTRNRVEVRWWRASALYIGRVSSIPVADGVISPSIAYVRYSEAATPFAVASGLDSAVVAHSRCLGRCAAPSHRRYPPHRRPRSRTTCPSARAVGRQAGAQRNAIDAAGGSGCYGSRTSPPSGYRPGMGLSHGAGRGAPRRSMALGSMAVRRPRIWSARASATSTRGGQPVVAAGAAPGRDHFPSRRGRSGDDILEELPAVWPARDLVVTPAQGMVVTLPR